MEIIAITRRWGRSLAIVIPHEIASKEHLAQDQEVLITVRRKRPKAGALFGRFPELAKTPTQQLKDEARRGWLSRSDRIREAKWRK